MRLLVAVTDNDWFALHASKTVVDEVNFWRPSPEATFKVLRPGELLLFKLRSPNDAIAGGGFYTRFLQMPINLAWETFGAANGVESLPEFRSRIARIRNIPMQSTDNPNVGCVMLAEPFFWSKSEWIPRPPVSIFLYPENRVNRNLLAPLYLAILTGYNLFLNDENCSPIVRPFSQPTNGQTSLHPRFCSGPRVGVGAAKCESFPPLD